MHRSRLAVVFLIAFVDLLGFGLILPLLPFYADVFGASDIVTGLLIASYAAAQLVGAPLLGRLSDRYGRRPTLLISIFGTLVGFILLGAADALWILFLSRILDGLTGGNISVVRAYITDVTEEKDRAKGLGLIGAAFGIGFIIGPAAGGLLSSIGSRLGEWGRFGLPAYVAAALALLNLILVFLLLPESLTDEMRATIALQTRPALTLNALWEALNRPRVGPLLHIRLFYGLAFATFQTVFAIYADKRLGLDEQATSFVLTYVGVLLVLVQGLAVGRLAAHFDEKRLIFWSSILMGFSLLAWALTPSVLILLVVLVPLALSGGVFNTVITSAISKAVRAEEVGGTLGIAAALESLTRVIGPVVGGLLIGQLGAWAPGILGSIIMLWVVFFAWRRLITKPDSSLSPRGEIIGNG